MVGTRLIKIYDSVTIICTKVFIIYITVTVPATSPCLHLMNKHSFPWCHCFHVHHHHHYQKCHGKKRDHFFAICGMEKLQQAVSCLEFLHHPRASIQAQNISLKDKMVKLWCVLIEYSSLIHITKGCKFYMVTHCNMNTLKPVHSNPQDPNTLF